MEATLFNPIQIQLLRMFDVDKSEKGLEELKDLLFRHYYQKMNQALISLWESGELNQERLNQINEMDLHKL